MSVKRVLLIAAMAMVLVPFAAQADTLSIQTVGGTASWSGLPGSTLQINNSVVTTVAHIPGPISLAFLGDLVNLTSGTYAGGGNFNPGGSFTMSGCGGTCLTGSFNGTQTLTLGNSLFSSFVASYVNPILLSALGFDPGNTQFAGILHFGLTTDANGNLTGGVSTGEIDLTPVPEPGSLAMLGSGLIGVAAMLRRKFSI